MTSSLFISALVALTIVGYLGLLPLLTKSEAPDRKKKSSELKSGDLEKIETQYQQLLNSIRDVDFDYDTGKVPDEVYAEQRKFLIGRSVSILRQLDDARSEVADIEDDIEAAVAALRSKSLSKTHKDKDIEKKITARRQRRQKVSY